MWPINLLKSLVRNFLLCYGLEIRRYDPLTSYHVAMSLMLCKHRYATLDKTSLETSFIEFCVDAYPNSYAQRGQDLFALWANLHEKHTSQFYCVEFGAADGIFISNTALLTHKFNWQALLIEPSPRFFKRLIKNRRHDVCIQGAVAGINDSPGKIAKFHEAGLYTIKDSLTVSESLTEGFKKAKLNSFDVVLYDLNELIEKLTKTSAIHYLSIDTEGSEYEILQTIDFGKYKFNALTVECESVQAIRAEKICSFLASKGYVRVFSYGITGVDLWFLPADHPLLNLE